MMIHIGFSPEGDRVYQDNEGGPHGMPGCHCMMDKHGIKKPYRGEVVDGVDFDMMVQGVQSMEDLATRFNDNTGLYMEFVKLLGNMVGEGTNKVEKNYPGFYEQNTAQTMPMEMMQEQPMEQQQQELPPELMAMMEQMPQEQMPLETEMIQ